MGACKSLLSDTEFEFCTPRQLKIESYHKTLPDIGAKQQIVYNELKSTTTATARELARNMYQKGLIPSKDDLNAVRPRLTELHEAGLIEVVGKKFDELSKRLVSIYKIKEANPHELF
jgi:sialic acid synthase SpsE